MRGIPRPRKSPDAESRSSIVSWEYCSRNSRSAGREPHRALPRIRARAQIPIDFSQRTPQVLRPSEALRNPSTGIRQSPPSGWGPRAVCDHSHTHARVHVPMSTNSGPCGRLRPSTAARTPRPAPALPSVGLHSTTWLALSWPAKAGLRGRRRGGMGLGLQPWLPESHRNSRNPGCGGTDPARRSRHRADSGTGDCYLSGVAVCRRGDHASAPRREGNDRARPARSRCRPARRSAQPSAGRPRSCWSPPPDYLPRSA